MEKNCDKYSEPNCSTYWHIINLAAKHITSNVSEKQNDGAMSKTTGKQLFVSSDKAITKLVYVSDSANEYVNSSEVDRECT